jgi:hypothetical protein
VRLRADANVLIFAIGLKGGKLVVIAISCAMSNGWLPAFIIVISGCTEGESRWPKSKSRLSIVAALKKQINPQIHATTQADHDIEILEACSTTGHIRRITVNGICYSQMCCGGQWQYFYKDTPSGRVWCTCNLGQTWNVNCSGNTWMVNCQ